MVKLPRLCRVDVKERKKLLKEQRNDIQSEHDPYRTHLKFFSIVLQDEKEAALKTMQPDKIALEIYRQQTGKNPENKLKKSNSRPCPVECLDY